jgi:hypothetical protein
LHLAHSLAQAERGEFVEVGFDGGGKVAEHKSFKDFAGCLGNPYNIHLLIEEMNEAIAEAGAGAEAGGK